MINFTTALIGKTIKTFKIPSSTRSRFPIFKYLSAFALVMMLGVNGVWGQSTVPTAYSLSSGSYTLSSHSSTSFPANMAIGTANNGTDGNFTTDIGGDASNGTSTGNWDDEGNNGISYQGGGSNHRGSFLFRAVSTNRSSITVAWTVRDITIEANTNYIELQWRSGSSGTWNNVTGDLYQQGTTSSGTSFSVVLPSGAENLADLRIRWIYYEDGSLSRDRLAIDEITVSSSTNFFWNGSTSGGVGPATGGNGTWNTSNTNWISPTNNGSGTGVVWGNIASSAANINNGTGTITIPSSLTASSTTIGTTGYTLATSGSSPITLSGGLTLTNGLSIAPISAAPFTLSGVVSGAGLLTVNGAGALNLNGANSNTGGVTLTSGTLNINNATALGTVASTLTVNGGTIDNTSGSGITLTPAYPVTVGSDLNFTGTNNLTFGSGAVALGASARQITVNANTLTFGGILTGSVAAGSTALTKTGAGTLALATSSTYTGKTVINGGAVSGTGESMFGANPGSFVADQITFNGGTLSASGSISFSSNRGITLTGTSNTINTNANTVTLTNVATGAGGYTKTGAGSLILAGAHTYTGATTISAGILQLNAAGTFPDASALSLAATTTFDLKGFSETIGSLAGAGGTVTSTAAGTLTLTAGGNNTSTTYAGIVQNGSATSVGLTKAGNGILTLSGANTYTGATAINAGTLALTGSGSIATSPTITVGSSGTFDVSGLTSALILGASQTLSGSATGSNTTGTIKVASSKNLTLSAGGLTFTALAATTTPPLTVDGTAGNLELVSGCAITVPNNLSAGTYTLIAKSGNGATVSGTAGTLNYTGSSNGTSASVAITSGELILTVTSSLTPPTLTAAGSATVDAAFDVTFTDDATWRAAITSITVGGTTLTAGYSVAAGQITFTPSASAPASLLQSSGSKSIEVIATGYSNATVTQSIGVGAANKLTMNTQPAAPSSNGGALATQPKVNITDQYGNLTSSTASITAAVGAGTWTLGGTTAVAAVSGTTTYSGLTATSAAAVTGATIDFTSAGLTGATTSTFNIPAPLVSPTVTTPTSASIVNTTATLGGDVTSDGGAAITARGVVWSVDATNNNPTIGGGGVTNVVGTGTTGVFTVNATGLPPNTLIAYRAYATNSVGTTYTTATTFTTLSVATKLVFGTAPSGTGTVGVNLTTFTVQAQRADNSVDAEYVANVAIARNIVSGSATLTGTTTVAAVAGTATFSAAQFDAVGTYTITAASGALTTATSGNVVVSVTNTSTTLYQGVSSAWLTSPGTNWSNGLPSSTNVAQFGTASNSTVGINMNGISLANRTVAAIELVSGASARTIDNSSTTVSNNFILSGGVVNGISNVILRNNSSNLMTITDGSSKTLGIELGNVTNNIINIDGTGGITVSCIISGSNPLTKAGSGSGVLTLSTGNTYTGKTFLTAGTVSTSDESAFGAAPGSFVADQITFNGGTLSASGNMNFSSNRGITFTGSSNTINTNANTVTLTNIATGAGGYTKTGAGILALAGAHTYTGATTLSAGILQLAGGNVGSVGAITSSPIGTSTLNLNGGTLSSNSTTARTVLNATSIGGDITLGDATNTGALTFSAATTISGASRTLTAASAVTFTGAIGDGGNAYGITKAGAGTLSLTAANTYTGLTTISAGILQLNRTVGTTIPVTNNATISGGTLKISTNQTLNDVTLTSGTLMVDNGVTLTINGNFTGGGTIQNNGTIILAGPSSFPGATTTISAMNNLAIDRASNVMLDQSITITGNLTLTNGKLITGACNSGTSNIALTMADNATITGVSASRFVDGILKKTGDDAFTFPIGSGAKYAPVNLTAPSVNTDRFAACYAGSNPNSSYSITSKAGSLNNVSKMEYWHINREVGTSSANVTLSWDTIARSGPVRDMTLLRVCRWDGSQWTNLGQTGTTGSNASGTITSGSVTSFSPFTLGSSGSANPLPVTWAYFTAQKTDGGNQLDWGTASEKNTSHFEIEYSIDGSNFLAMNDKINAAGNSAHLLEYRCIHKLSPPLIYYRIKQVDLDGLYDYSKTIILKNKDVTSKNFIKVLPSYVQSQEPLTMQGYESNMPSVFYEIINGQGQRILSDKISTIDGYFHHSLSLEMYPTGLYYLRVFNSDLNNIYQGKIRK